MKRFFPSLLLFLSLFCLGTSTQVSAEMYSTTYTTIDIPEFSEAILPGSEILITLNFNLKKGWHTYGPNPGKFGYPLKIIWDLPSGIIPGKINWPKEKEFKFSGFKGRGFSGAFTLSVPLKLSDEITSNHIPLKAKIKWLVCEESCIPESVTINERLPILGHSFFSTLFKILFLAFVGGFILNAMPCVFPILSLKAMSIIEASQKSLSIIRRESFLYTTGVITSFWVLVAILLGVKTTGTQLGWGFHLQSPIFISVLIYVMLMIGLYFSGLVSLPRSIISASSHIATKGQKYTKGHNIWGSFFTGVLATVVATPCTAPFMATAIGFSLTQKAPVVFLIFTFLGLGLSSPFLLISMFPNLLKYLPRPGAWMLRLQKILAIPIYLTAIWLIWVLFRQTALDSVIISGLACVGIIIASISIKFSHKKQTIVIISTLLGLSLLLSLVMIKRSTGHEDIFIERLIIAEENKYTKETLAMLREKKERVFVNVTAAWCITCQINKKRVLETAEIQANFKSKNIHYLVADWTQKDDDITEFLSEHKRLGVPLYVYYDENETIQILPQLLTKTRLLSL